MTEASSGQGGAASPTGGALEGALGPFVAADVLQFLRLAGVSGRLEFRRAGECIEVAFAHGRPVWARSNARAVRLGDVMLHRGWMSAEALAAALVDQRLRRQKLGRVLRERGIPDEHVVAAVGEVFRRLVCLLSLWPDGRFRFVPGAEADPDDVPLELELERLILEGLHQADLALDAS